MNRTVAVVVSLFFAGPVLAGDLEDAFAACKTAILENLVAVEQRDLVTFASIEKVNWSRDDEFYFAFKSGTIQGTSRAKVDWLTKSTKPSASCVGSLKSRTFSFVTVNGQDVETPKGF